MLNKAIEDAVIAYKKDVGMNNSRRSENMKKRAALICAMSRVLGMSDREISMYVRGSRTVILHHRRKHESNKMSWGGYLTTYNKAKQVIGQVIEAEEEREYRAKAVLEGLAKMKQQGRPIDESLTIIAAIQIIKEFNQ